MSIANRVTLILALSAFLAGCAPDNNTGPEGRTMVGRDIHRDTDAAIAHNDKGFELIRKDKLDAAEKELRVAVGADSFYGPAHNNLGSVYYQQKKYYQAACEYQLAAKIMPDNAAPLSNLGLVLETTGKVDEAIKCYQEALESQPNQVETIANLARAYVREGRKDDKTREALTAVVMRDHRPEWSSWARRQLAMMGPAKMSDTQPSPITPADNQAQAASQPASQPMNQPDDQGLDED